MIKIIQFVRKYKEIFLKILLWYGMEISMFHSLYIFYTLMASLTVPAVPGKAAEYLMMVQCSPNIV